MAVKKRKKSISESLRDAGYGNSNTLSQNQRRVPTKQNSLGSKKTKVPTSSPLSSNQRQYVGTGGSAPKRTNTQTSTSFSRGTSRNGSTGSNINYKRSTSTGTSFNNSLYTRRNSLNRNNVLNPYSGGSNINIDVNSIINRYTRSRNNKNQKTTTNRVDNINDRVNRNSRNLLSFGDQRSGVDSRQNVKPFRSEEQKENLYKKYNREIGNKISKEGEAKNKNEYQNDLKNIRRNGVSGAGVWYEDNPIAAMEASGFKGADLKKYSHMTDDEKLIASWIFENKGREAGLDYLSTFNQTLINRQAEKESEELTKKKKEASATKDFILDVETGVKGAVSDMLTGFGGSINTLQGDKNVYDTGVSSTVASLQYQKAKENQEKAEKLEAEALKEGDNEKLEKARKLRKENLVSGYTVGGARTITNMIPMIGFGALGGSVAGAVGLTGKAAKAASAVASSLGMFTNTYGQDYQQSIKEGHTVEEAKRFAFADSLSETVTEQALGGLGRFVGGIGKKTIGKVIEKPIGKIAKNKVLRNYVADMVKEGNEEWVQQVFVSPFVNEYAYSNGQQYKQNLAIADKLEKQALKTNNKELLDQAEALRKDPYKVDVGELFTKKNTLSDEAVESAILGAVSAGVMNGLPSMHEAVTRRAVDKTIDEHVKQLNKTVDDEADFIDKKQYATDVGLRGIEKALDVAKGTLDQLYTKEELVKKYGEKNVDDYYKGNFDKDGNVIPDKKEEEGSGLLESSVVKDKEDVNIQANNINNNQNGYNQTEIQNNNQNNQNNQENNNQENNQIHTSNTNLENMRNVLNDTGNSQNTENKRAVYSVGEVDDDIKTAENGSHEAENRGVVGKKGVAYTNDNERVDYDYELVDVEDLIVSHDINGEENANYPKELQPRDRDRLASDTQTNKIASELNPARLTISNDVSTGAPVIGMDNVVESGNGRIIGLTKAMRYRPENITKYTNYLKEHAAEFGLSPEDIKEGQILVRRRTNNVNRSDFVRVANESNVAQMSATEQAKVDAEKISNDILDLFVANDNGEIQTKDNTDFIKSFVDNVASENERGNLIDSNGYVTQNGINRIKNAIFAKAYNLDNNLIIRLTETTDNDAKKVTAALLGAAPRITKIKQQIEKGNLYNLEFSDDIRQGTKLFLDLKERNMSVDEYINQISMVSDGISAESKAMAYVLEQNKNSSNKIVAYINYMCDIIEELGSPNQTSLLGAEFTGANKTKGDIIYASERRFNNLEEESLEVGLRYDKSRTDRETYGNEEEERQRQKVAKEIADNVKTKKAPVRKAKKINLNEETDVKEEKKGKAPIRKRKVPTAREEIDRMANKAVELAQEEQERYEKTKKAYNSEEGEDFTVENGEKYGFRKIDVNVINEVAKDIGVKVKFKYEGENINGSIKGDTIYINPEKRNDAKFIFAHELTHYLENSNAYTSLEDFVKKEFGKEIFEDAAKRRIKLNESVGNKISIEDARREVVADYAGTFLFEDEHIAKRLVREDVNLFTKIKDFLDKIWNLYKYKFKYKYIGRNENAILKAERLYRKIYDDVKNNPKRENFYRKYSLDPSFEQTIDDILNKKSKKNLVKVFAKTPIPLLKSGMENYAMYMTKNHVISIVLSEEEAKEKGFPLQKGRGKNRVKINYHALGKDGLIKVFKALENPKAIYRYIDNSGTRYNSNDFIIETGLNDNENNPIIVTARIVDGKIYIEEGYYEDYNLITSAYGKNNFNKYIENLLNDKKIRVTYSQRRGVVGLANDESKNSYTNSISQENENATPLSEKNENILEEDTQKTGRAPKKSDLEKIKNVKYYNKSAKLIVQAFNGAKEAKDSFMQNFVNGGHEVDKIGDKIGNEKFKNYYNAINHATQSANFMIGMYQTDIKGNRVGKSLREILQNINDMEDFTRYLLHKLNIERIDNGKPIDAKYSKDDSYKAIRDFERTRPNYKETANEVYQYIDNLMQYRVDSGLVDKETKSFLKGLYPSYIPIEKYDPYRFKGMRNRNSLITNNGIRTVEGFSGFKDILDIDKALARMTQSTVKNAKRNMLLQEMAAESERGNMKGYIDVLEEVDMDKLVDSEILRDDKLNIIRTVEEPARVTMYRDGKKVTLAVQNPELLDSLKQLDGYVDENSFMNTTLMQGVAKGMDIFKKSVTSWDPTFMIRNFCKDMGDALLYAPELGKFGKNYFKAIKEIASNGKMWQLYQAVGGLDETYYSNDNIYFEEHNQKALDFLRDLKDFKFKSLKEVIPYFNKLIEQAPRLSEFITQIEEGGDSYANITKALYRANDITVNFSRGGKVTKMANKFFIPFVNPTIQGTDKLLRTLTKQKNGKAFAKLIMTATIYGTGVAFVNEVIHHYQGGDDDDEYEKITDYVKNSYFLFRTSKGKYLRVPKGRVASAIGIISKESIDKLFNGEDIDVKGMWGAIMEEISPMPSSTIISPITDAVANKNYYGNEIVNETMQALAPKDQYDENTDELSKILGAKLNLSPKKINYVLEQYSGVVGRLGLPLITEGDYEKNPLKILGKSFVTDTAYSNRVNNEWYSKEEELSDTIKREKHSGIEGTTGTNAAQWYLNSVNDEIYKLYGEKKRLADNDKLTNEQKKEKQRDIQLKINKLREDCLKNIDTVKKEGDKLYKKKKAVYYTDYAQILYDKVSAEESLKAISNDKSDTSLKDAYENAKSLKKAGISYEDQAKFYLDYKKIKFKKKSEVKGSKTDLYIKSLDSLKISSTKKAILLYSTPGYFGKNLSISKYKTAFGLSDSEARFKMANYLNDLKLSWKERKKMLKNAGYTIEDGYICW